MRSRVAEPVAVVVTGPVMFNVPGSRRPLLMLLPAELAEKLTPARLNESPLLLLLVAMALPVTSPTPLTVSVLPAAPTYRVPRPKVGRARRSR